MNTIIISGLILLIIFIPIALVIVSIDERRKRKIANRFPCTNCGHIIGSPAIDLADIKQREQIDRLQRQHPELKSRLPPRTIHAICTRCGTNFKYLEKDKIFKVKSKISNVESEESEQINQPRRNPCSLAGMTELDDGSNAQIRVGAIHELPLP